MEKIIKVCICFLGISLIGCARMGTPEGGPKDEDAPIMMTAKPPYETLNFDKKNIRIYFDEYIVLKDLTKQLVVSPPMKNPALISPQGTPSKYINIEIIDTLKKNTTYTFNFGQAVQDNNEGNKLEGFKYVFSTGNDIDSLKIKGNTKHASKRDPEKSVGVLLYKLDSTFNDSIVYKRKPDYVTSTLDTTVFNFTHIKEGKYLMLALKEANPDYLFNAKTDLIGFVSDTIVLPRDTIVEKDIRLFKEAQPFQFKRGKEVSKGKIQFGFLGGIKKEVKVNLLSKVPEDFKTFYQFEKDKDTLLLWHAPIKRDSLNFLVTYREQKDTVTVRLRKKKIDSLSITSSVNDVLHLKDTLFLTTNNPVMKIDTTKVNLVDVDTLDVKYKLKKIDINKLALVFDKKPRSAYSLTVYPEAITDLFEYKNDTLAYQFSTRDIEDYGSIVLDVNNPNNKHVILELLTKEGKNYEVFKRRYIQTSKKVTFDLLEPKEYLIRAVIDENKNNKWDTGNYLKRLQPEKIIYFDKKFMLRANWIQNEQFKVE